LRETLSHSLHLGLVVSLHPEGGHLAGSDQLADVEGEARVAAEVLDFLGAPHLPRILASRQRP
jgi:hypothetical protein